MQEHGLRARPKAAAALSVLRRNAHPLIGKTRDYAPLLELIGEARFALLGEASHGTYDFYLERCRDHQAPHPG